MKIFTGLIFVIALASANKEEFTKSNNLFFTPALYKQVLKTNKGNFLISPFSAEIALAFAQSGCKDETAQEICTALGLSEDKDKIEKTMKELLPSLAGNDQYTLHTANKMYVKKDFSIKEEFKKVAVDVFGADSENINFKANEEAAKIMNDWVEKHTNNKIHNLIDPNVLDEVTRVVLINALYFQANWSKPFGVGSTVKEDFFKTATDSVKVDMMKMQMWQHPVFKYFECHHLNAKFLELPFEGGEASMTVVLPNEKEGIKSLEEQIERVFKPHDLQPELVVISLPKFKIETKLDLEEMLKNMGVKKVFKDDEADLSGIAGKKGDLVIDKVKQKSFVNVNEEGVEAAAATYAHIAVPTSAIVSSNPKEFIADHPFIFFIKVKDVIVFVGRYASPDV